MNKKRNLFLRFFAVLLAVLMLCMQLLPVGAAGEDEDRDAMISLYAALEVFYGVAGDILSSYGGPETYAFSGSVNEDNIDRIAGTALLLDVSFYPDAYAGHLAAGALPGSLVESAIVTYFDVGDVDLSQSKNYDRNRGGIHTARRYGGTVGVGREHGRLHRNHIHDHRRRPGIRHKPWRYAHDICR